MNCETQKKRKLHSSPQIFSDSASDCSFSKDDHQLPYPLVEVIGKPNRSPFTTYQRFNRVLTPEPVTESSPNRLRSSPFSPYPLFNEALKQELCSESSFSRVCYSQLSSGNVVLITACEECDEQHMPTVDGDEKSKPLMSQLMAQLSCKEESTSTTNLEGVTEGSSEFWNNIVHKQGETISGSLGELNQQNLEQMVLAAKLKNTFDFTSDEDM